MYVPNDHEDRIRELEDALEVLSSESKALHERVRELEGAPEPAAGYTPGPIPNSFTTSDFHGGRESVSE
jgi:hypothetical protein